MSFDILSAVLDGNTEAINSISHDGEIFRSTTQKEKWNLLHQALLSPDPTRNAPVAMVAYLIGKGVDVRAVDCYGNTPLHYAARARNAKAMKLLLEAGADIDAVNLDCVTPLRQSLLQKPYLVEATELLLSRGANQEAKGRTGKTVRDYVNIIAFGSDAWVRELFERYQLPSHQQSSN